LSRTLKAPYPWFGGKSAVATQVWQRFGKVRNYVEPFFGSGAMLLARPTPFDGPETVNDADCYLANFWRALRADAEAVAEWTDWPVNEADLHARHLWLIAQDEFRERMKSDPEYYDARVAGWWVWGLCKWIGGGWCAKPHKRRPHLGDQGRGVDRPSQKRPHLGDQGRGEIYDYFRLLSDRFRRVRVCCGDWSRVCGPTPTVKQGLTAVFLDPPYSAEAGRENEIYAVENLTVAHDVREWCLERGDDPLIRIALCGYEGEHDELEQHGWDVVAWKARGGYARQGRRGEINARRERIWYSPHCINPHSLLPFGD